MRTNAKGLVEDKVGEEGNKAKKKAKRSNKTWKTESV